jgi:SAM-dependent methyltransferase
LLNNSVLARIFGFPALLIHGDLLVLDRWRWLKKHLPKTRNGESLVDIGCGTGAFTIGAALRGYKSVGLSWDARNQTVARERAKICKVEVEFPIRDVRALGLFDELKNRFDMAICFENIEHILDDRKLVRDIAACLKPGGQLLLTTPNYYYQAVAADGLGPFSRVEDGGHVRRGYTAAMLKELCVLEGLVVDEISYCSGFFSQKATAILYVVRPTILAWALVLPLRILPILFDGLIAKMTVWPPYSICMVAYKPRFSDYEK